MGFYNEADYFDLPHKRIVDDLLERNGPSTKESFTPYKGMNDLIAEQGLDHLAIEVIKENIEEFPVKTVLENSDESYVANYLRNQLIALKNKEFELCENEENEKVQDTMVDPETGEAFLLSDVYVADEYEESHATRSVARSRIPYLLKKLQDGSIQYGVSLLSLFIARDGVIEQLDRASEEIQPHELLAYPIYRVTDTGELMDTIDPETANDMAKFRVPKDLVLGVEPTNEYYTAGIELTIRANQLGYNLYEEDVTDYTPSYVNRLRPYEKRI